MKRNLMIMTLLLALFACKKEETSSAISSQSTSDSTIATSNTAPSASEHFQEFDFPDSIQGCSCSFATDKKSFDEGNFIFADDYGAKAMVKYQDQFLEFPMEEGDFDPSYFQRTLKNNGFTLKMKAQKLNSDPEAMIFQGTMTLITPDGKQITSTIYGECAC